MDGCFDGGVDGISLEVIDGNSVGYWLGDLDTPSGKGTNGPGEVCSNGSFDGIAELLSDGMSGGRANGI